MSTDLWEQLAEHEVPAPPREFDRDVQQRLNKLLVLVQLTDLLLRGMALAVGHFAQAVMHLLILTLTGRLDGGIKRKNENE